MLKKSTRLSRAAATIAISISATACATAPDPTPIDSACAWLTAPRYTCEDVDAISPVLARWLIEYIDATEAACEIPPPKCMR